MLFRGSLLTSIIAALCACGDGGGFPDAPGPDAAPPGGTFTVAWMVTDTAHQAVSCDDVGASSVVVTLRDRSKEGGFTEAFSCSSGKGTSPAVPPAIYDMDFELSGGGQTLAIAPRQSMITIKSNTDTDLAPIAFALDATGALDLQLTANKPGGNCKAVSQMGAGITATTITLVHGAGACAPVTFTITPGATKPGGTYTVNCGSPQVAPCIETDQHLQVANVGSGPYVIHIRGKIGATDCYKNDDSLRVPSLSRTYTTTLNLGYQMGTPGC